MERISSLFFLIALLIYYIPRVLKLKKSKYINLHIATGIISILAMILAFILKIGQVDFLKYLGFAIIMILIGITGYFIKRNHKKYRILHMVCTILFFVYLYCTIAIF